MQLNKTKNENNNEKLRFKVKEHKEKLSKVENELEAKTKQLIEYLRRDCSMNVCC